MDGPGRKASPNTAGGPHVSSPESVAAMQHLPHETEAKLARLRAEIDKGEADIADGRFTSIANDQELEGLFAWL